MESITGESRPAVRDDDAARLIRESYREVLDATKHQDDKIGRLLTAIAFLTAASIGLANLASGRYVFAIFDVGGTEIPVVAITVGVFLVGVLLAVVMLLSSLTAPLSLPSGGGRRRQKRTASLLYFYSIAGFSESQWRSRWERDPDVIVADMHEDYVGEVHNLAVRTNYKYNRTTEAVGVLRFALLAFGLSALLVVLAGVRGWDPSNPKPVDVDIVTRLLIDVVVAGFCSVQVLATMRDSSRRVDDDPPRLGSSHGYLLWAGPLLVSAILLPPELVHARAAGVVAIGVAMIVGAQRKWLDLVPSLLGLAGMVSLGFGNLSSRLACAVSVAAALVAYDILKPAYTERRARRRFIDSQAE